MHLSENDFFELLNKRLNEYHKVIAGRANPGLFQAMKISSHHNIQRLKIQLEKSGLFAADLWGYGINSISDGNESYSSIDLEEFRKINDLNKHHHEQRLFWLLTFKISDNALYVSIFCLDPVRTGFNSDLNTKIPLKDFNNVRVRNRKSNIHIDLIFEKMKHPVSFQVDTYGKGNKLHGQELADYYVKQIESAAEKSKKETESPKEHKLNQQIESELDLLELTLRDLFVETLEKNHHEKKYSILLTGRHKSDVRSRIKTYVDKHPNSSISDFEDLREAIQFSDLDHLKKSMIHQRNWSFFEPVFKNSDRLSLYFDQLSALRHTIKHSRKLTELIRLEGQASLEWFTQILK